MDSLHRNSAGDRPKRYGGDPRISDDEWITDARTGELRLSERGITRQREDILARAAQLGAEVCEWYTENDTTAFKRKRIRLPNGRSVWRVYRPEFRRMLADYEDGKIDGIITSSANQAPASSPDRRTDSTTFPGAIRFRGTSFPGGHPNISSRGLRGDPSSMEM